jgi:hypothetical protein
MSKPLERILAKTLVGVGQIGARAAARAYGSVLADVNHVARGVVAKVQAAEAHLRAIVDDEWDNPEPPKRERT